MSDDCERHRDRHTWGTIRARPRDDLFAFVACVGPMWLASSYHATISSIKCSVEPVRMLTTVRQGEGNAATGAIEKQGVEVKSIPNRVRREKMGGVLQGETGVVNPRDSFS